MSIQGDANSLREVIGRYVGSRERLHAERLSAEQMTARHDELLAEAHQDALSLVKDLWGTYETGKQLQGGSVWAALEGAEKAVEEARGSGDDVFNFSKLQYERGLIEQKVTRTRSLDELYNLYAQMDKHQQRAMQDSGPTISRRFGPGVPGMGSFLAALRRDRESVSSPGLPKAEAARDAIVAEIANAHEASQSAARMIDLGPGNPINRIVGKIQARQRVVTTGAGAGVFMHFSKQPELGPPAEIPFGDDMRPLGKTKPGRKGD